MKILVAEDNPLNMELVKDLLELDGHTVEAAEDGLKAIELAAQLHPDVVLMDVQLPKLDGLEATRRLRADPATREIPVIALTASAMIEDRERVIEAGCIGHIAKPIDTANLGREINALLRQHDLKRAA